ncbi:hypothetical protein BG004_003630 [Podila humilis]|nr:hypothetical protein BG004_003630 [Podila humilis]
MTSPAPKRNQDVDKGYSPKRSRYVYTVRDAIEDSGLTKKAVVNGRFDLNRLDSKERVSLLGFFGEELWVPNKFYSLSTVARAHQRNSSFQELEILSTSSRTERFPVLKRRNLYVRQAYKDLYDELISNSQDRPEYREESQVVITGTTGIENSAFLLYFTIRLLASSHGDNPPIVIFHEKRASRCYVYGGLSTVRSGDIKDFGHFLELPESWYLVDSFPDPMLPKARTIISASPSTLKSNSYSYNNMVVSYGLMDVGGAGAVPELEQCRSKIRDFAAVSKEFLEELYDLTPSINGPAMASLLDVLMKQQWTDTPEQARLVFVVPSDIYDDFQAQGLPPQIQQ